MSYYRTVRYITAIKDTFMWLLSRNFFFGIVLSLNSISNNFLVKHILGNWTRETNKLSSFWKKKWKDHTNSGLIFPESFLLFVFFSVGFLPPFVWTSSRQSSSIISLNSRCDVLTNSSRCLWCSDCKVCSKLIRLRPITLSIERFCLQAHVAPQMSGS